MKTHSILYEDEDILIANKQSPIPVQQEKSGDPSLQDLLRAELAARSEEAGRRGAHYLEAAHRIDRRASGTVLFAKTPKSLVTLQAAFRSRRIGKLYLACVEAEPQPESGELVHRLVWDKRKNLVRATSISPGEIAQREENSDSGKSKNAKKGGFQPDIGLLRYRLVGKSDRYWFVEAELLTGRHHQIRAQFAAAGFPIRGDLKYGARRSAANGLIMLHAYRLAFDQPRTGEGLEIVAPFPESETLWQAYSAPDGKGGLTSPA